MFQLSKKYQANYHSITWQQKLQRKQVLKNNFQTHGDIKKAKAFVKNMINYSPHKHFAEHEEHILFKMSDLAVSLEHVYNYAA